MKSILRPAALLLAAAALASCWHPLFDTGASLSGDLAKRLGNPVLSISLQDIKGDYAQNAWFVPRRTDLSATDPVEGLFIKTEGVQILSFPLVYERSTNSYFDYSGSGYSTSNLLGDFPIVVAAPDGGSTVYLVARKDYFIFWDLSTQYRDTWSFPGGAILLGAGSVANLDSTDTLALCYLDSGSLEYETLPTYASGLPGFSGSGVSLAPPALDYISTPGAFFDLGAYLYLSCGMVDGTHAIFRWESATASTLAPIRYPAVYGPLVAALSDGRLLACDGSATTVLSATMSRLFSFPSGTLRFVHERWDGTQNICVFTRTSFVRTESGDNRGTLKIEVFEIPTSELERLGT